jgi:hypothetical protein
LQATVAPTADLFFYSRGEYENEGSSKVAIAPITLATIGDDKVDY